MSGEGELARHERELEQLLHELGGILFRRERLLDRERRTRNRVRMEQITEEARRPFARLDRETLVRDLERELGYQRLREQELQERLQLARLRSRTQDAILQEISRHLPPGRESPLLEDLHARTRRREELLANLPERPPFPQETTRRLEELEDHQKHLDDLLYRLAERHLLALHHGQTPDEGH
ncbi:hypothetical protein RxyAA322_01950 [Rubrobacter xylanophilus]|uniref:Uncharacterized protein n=1 Tax=Rubrobacter xylanophilus TaxID=49319 RepID=A0A510HEH4_9ACTN|nr:hypothetical protein [Rubrobacter xylanophilus]BBL78341.1 hypothetical protein RxyAA322_01950 [Rubrobacter xylanophilus]